MFILVTVPHAHCLPKMPNMPNQQKRICDIRASHCAKLFTDLLRQNAIEHKTIRLHVLRELVDVNREKPSMETINNATNLPPEQKKEKIENLSTAIKEWNKFNNRISQTLMLKKTQPIMLIDVHSFPKGSFANAQIAILDLFKKNRHELKQLVTQVQRDLHINIKLIKGGKNYIQDQYQEVAYPLLIEFCEDKTYLSDATIQAFFKHLLQFYRGETI